MRCGGSTACQLLKHLQKGEEGRRGKKRSQILRFLSTAASALLSWVVKVTSYGPLQPPPLGGVFRMDRNDWKILYVLCVCVRMFFVLFCFQISDSGDPAVYSGGSGTLLVLGCKSVSHAHSIGGA